MERILRSRRQGLGWSAIAKEVGHIPEKLHDLYTELLQDLAGGEKACSQKMFQWICFAKRRLLLDELRWAMIVDVDSPHRSLRESRGAEDYDSDMEKRVQTLSRGLAEVKLFPEGTVVQFIHPSAQDFIIGNYLSMLTTGNDEAAMSQTGMLGHSHYRLSGTCLRYLAMEEIALSIQNNPEAKEIESRFPFLRYATTSWVTHMAQIDTVDEAQDLLRLLAWPSNALIELWSHVYQIIDGNSSDCPPAATSLLHLISKSGALTPLKAILQMADTITREASRKDGHGRIPLHYAAENGHEAVAVLLLGEDGAGLDAEDSDGSTPLYQATKNSHAALVRLLLELGANASAQAYCGMTPLHHAAENGHEAIMRLLLQVGRADMGAKDRSGRTSLHKVAKKGHEALARLLLEAGADAGAKADSGMTPLHYAARYGHEAVARLLLMGGAGADVKDEDGWTPLHCAVDKAYTAVVSLLLEAGADPDARDQDGRTPLHHTVMNDDIMLSRSLLDGGADMAAKDNEGHTAFNYAAQFDYHELEKFLFQRGARPDVLSETDAELGMDEGGNSS